MAQSSGRQIVLRSVGHEVPDTVLDNAFFDELDIGSDAGWIEDRVGIKERRSVLPRAAIMALRKGEITRSELLEQGKIISIADMVVPAWQMVRERLPGDDQPPVDTVISGTSVPDWDIPAHASAIAAKLDLKGACFDTNSACSSFVTDLHVARGLLHCGASDHLAVFNAERYTTRVDYSDRKSCVLFGDSATAAYLQATTEKISGLRLVDTHVHSDPSGYDQVRLPVGGHFWQNGQAVQKFAVTRTVEAALEVLDRNSLAMKDLSYLICHQANLRMLKMVTRKLGLEPDQHLSTVERYGNQGASGAPTTLSENWHRFQPGDLVVVAVVGSGLTWGAALFEAQ